MVPKIIHIAGNSVIENFFSYIFNEWNKQPTDNEVKQLVDQFINLNKVLIKLPVVQKAAISKAIINSIYATFETETFKEFKRRHNW